jgi:hypothetical protein
MYHYSYVFPDQVFKKIAYYKDAVSRDVCIDDYFTSIYLPWVTKPSEREMIESVYMGVHEYKPRNRGACYTAKFDGNHPESIIKNMNDLNDKFNKQLKLYKND